MKFTLILVASVLAAASAQKPIYLITAPNIVHLGVEETVTVQLEGATQPVNIKLYFREQTNDALISEQRHVVLKEDNGYKVLVKLKVDSILYKSATQKTNVVTPYIQLVADSKDIFPKNQHINKHLRMVSILLSNKKGYIFIQTDKPIYNPGEKVQFRLFTLDNYLLPINEAVQLKVFNCKGLLVYSYATQSNHILQRTIAIPDVEPAGNWKIVASFLNFPMSNTTAEFEVREYVLPSFEVNIEASKSYHLLREESIKFNVSARHTYGKGIDGVAYVRFGLRHEQGNTTYLPGIEKQTPIQNGIASITLLTKDLQSKAEHQGVPHVEGYHLYIAVTALETASGDLEEAVSSAVKIVTTPYIVDLSKTKQYFTPGGMFSILATTTYADGNPAPLLRMRATVSVKDSEKVEESVLVEGLGDTSGEVALTFKVPSLATSMDIKVFAEGEEQDVILSDAHVTATATQSEDESYLSVEIQHQILGPGQQMTVTFRDITPSTSTRPQYIYYMLLSKGRVVQMNRLKRTDLTTLNLSFSEELVPSFRLVAYYFRGNDEKAAIVADSLWVDVKDVCKGKIEIHPFKERRPAEVINVEISTDKAEKLALAAVDKAVYILNKQNKLSSRKMFEYMNSYDLACSMGGGLTHTAVLEDAGLTFIFNKDFKISMRKDYSCSNTKKRSKRALNHAGDFSKIVNSYKDELRKCCSAGVKLIPARLSCQERCTKTRHLSEACQTAFLNCCNNATILRKNIKASKLKYSLARTLPAELVIEEEAIDDVSVHLRSYFPHTWMWKVIDVDASGDLRHSVVLPDSITTWEVQAVGISKQNGFCIAEPKELKVFQDFFVSLKLPHSVKRNEQLEVKAVVYNYRTESLEVTVEMNSAKGLCSAEASHLKQEVTVPGNSATAVYFTVIPLVIGNIPIRVHAYASKNAQDQVTKDLKVMGEGELVSLQNEYNIDGRTTKSLTLDIPFPSNAVPGQESDVLISIRGGIMGESVDNCLSLEGVDKLIALPTGCAEQTMVTMSPAIHAIKYLDATGLWVDLKAERRDEAIGMIQNGYNRILTFKKNDGSYGAFQRTPSSVWLTAFIAKELTQSRSIIPVEDSFIQESISYLVAKQMASGAFNDPHPLYDRTMKGGVGGFEGDVSLTAFILLAMHHSLPLYFTGEDTEVRWAMEKAQAYLVEKLNSLQKPFAVAITAYALSVTALQSEDAQQAQTKLREMAKCDEEKDTCHWDAHDTLGLEEEKSASQAESISVETTAYALLQTLESGDFPYATRIAKWLTEQRKYGGGFRSTQDTVVALEALAKFSIHDDKIQNLNLKVEMCFQRGPTKTVQLTKSNALTLPAFQVKPGKVTVNLEGNGKGTISVIQTYRTLKKTDSHCDFYHLTLSVEGEVKYKTIETYDDDEDADLDYMENEEEGISNDEPLSRIEWFDLRSRKKRQAPQETEKESSLVYKVCVGMKKGISTGMVIVDISLLSGLELNIQDLEDNAKGIEKYIDHYDIGPNKVYLYFKQITNVSQCVYFRAKQITPMGLVQPAGAVIYDYYNPERRCGVFYNAPQKSKMLSKLCKGDVCSCAEGSCPKMKNTFSKNMGKDTRIHFACFSSMVDYVYVVKIINSTDDSVFTYYTTLVKNNLQTGEENLVQGHARVMVKRNDCDKFNMGNQKEYLIMGKQGSISEATDANGKFMYFLDSEMWIEEIPEENKCRATKSRKSCQFLHNFMGQYELNQCSI